MPDRAFFVYHDRRLAEAEQEKIVRGAAKENVQTFMIERRFDGLNLNEVLEPLAHFGVANVLVEPGPTLARGFFDQQTLADRVLGHSLD